MPLFAYKARSSRGDSVKGEIEAASADAVASQLISSGITPLEINETQPKQDIFADLKVKLASSKPTLDDLILFCRQMYTLNRARLGRTLTFCLS